MTKRTDSSHPGEREQVNRLLEQWKERRATKGEWERYKGEGWEPYEIAARISEDRTAGRHIAVEPVPAAATSHPELVEFLRARTLLAARAADADPRVSAWREQHLGDGLLHVERASEWIEQQAATAGPASRFATVLLPPEWQKGQAIPTDGRAVGITTHPLLYVTGSSRKGDQYAGGHIQRAPTVAGGALDQLRELSNVLADTHGWSPASATMWVLTGVAPAPDVLSVGVAPAPDVLSVQVEQRWSSDSPARQRITVSADPDVPPDVVAAVFRAERAKLRGPRARLPQARLSRLVAFAAQHQASSSKQLRTWWNQEHPDDTYSDARAFRQALGDARRRVLGQPRAPRVAVAGGASPPPSGSER